ncbi:YicC/YloC family endoribonuclease [Acidaminobacterium chupaoyuni]
MLKSMTGYGRKKAENALREITVEIKSVNHRYLDLNMKVPRIYSFLEDSIKTAVSAEVSRGKVDVYVSVYTKEGKDITVTVNMPLIEGYLRSLEQIRDRFQLKDDISVMGVAKLPDALELDKEEPDTQALTEEVLQVVTDTLSEYNTMRTVEGQRLCEDILARGALIAEFVDRIEARSPAAVEEYKQKIAQRMQEILGAGDITDQRILQEAALFADKVSVTEELVRLRSHLKQLDTMLHSKTAMGRKLDFLVQELNRETNTIGSKANDYEIAQIVIDCKAEIEKIREQIQNLE